MKDAAQVREPTLSLPPHAPLVRLTAGVGSAGQKTWNLRRPITLIGSRRPAHIVLHDKDVSSAHCVIVNTGTDILLKDLHTSGGTRRQRDLIDLVALKDGDVLTLGETSLQVAIQVSENPVDDSTCGLKYFDPAKFPGAVRCQLLGTTTAWPIEDAVAMLGSHKSAAVCLDHKDIAARHAILFKFQNQPAVFDISTKGGIWINGQRASLSMLDDGVGLTVGPFGITVSYNFPTPTAIAAALPPASLGGGSTARSSEATSQQASKRETGVAHGRLSDLDAALSELERNLAGAWDQLNNWGTPPEPNPTPPPAPPVQVPVPPPAGPSAEDFAALSAELEAKEAALRGRLHDVTRLHEQIVEREKEIAVEHARLQEVRDELSKATKDFEEKETDLTRRIQEVQRRENATSQRLSRMRATTCPHCRKPIPINNGGRP